jgi:hypothetical protein
MVIVGSSALQDSDGAAVLANAIVLADRLRSKSNDDWKVLNVLHRHAGQVGALDVGYIPGPSALKEVILLLWKTFFDFHLQQTEV